MYRELEAELVRKGVSRKKLSELIGIAYRTLGAKMRGEQDFNLEECKKIKNILNSDMYIDVLFKKEN